jgi:hypothetical protein
MTRGTGFLASWTIVEFLKRFSSVPSGQYDPAVV